MKRKDWHLVGISLVLCMMFVLGGCAAGNLNVKQPPTGNPLPSELAGLPTIVAEPWVKVSEEQFTIEGPAFDKQGNLYVAFGGSAAPVKTIFKVTPDRKVSSVISDKLAFNGIAVHKDGRLFVAAGDSLVIMNPDGKVETTLKAVYNGETLMLNDVVFDNNGNLYITDFRGTPFNPIGGVYRIDASENYATFHQVFKGLAAGNGISFAPNGNTLWVGETCGNHVYRVSLLPDGLHIAPIGGVNIPFTSTGDGGIDSNKMDTAGNLYQTINNQGRVVILNQWGVPVANVTVPGREEGKHLRTANLAFKPGTNTAYLVAGGEGGAWVYTFSGFAPGQMLYSHR